MSTLNEGGAVDRVAHLIALLRESGTYRDPNPGRNHITGQLHALRCAALMANHGDEAALIGLVHDLARPLSDVHHGEVIAEIVRDRVSQEAYEALRDHGTMQALVIRNQPLPDDATTTDHALCAAEVASFAKDYTGPTMTLGEASRLISQWLT